MAASKTAPVARQKSTTKRIMGNPKPGFCPSGWGYSA